MLWVFGFPEPDWRTGVSRQAPEGLQEVPQEAPTPISQTLALKPSHCLDGGHSQLPTVPSRPPKMREGGERGVRISLVLQAKCSYSALFG